jgi:small subunit ribosomal protein S16
MLVRFSEAVQPPGAGGLARPVRARRDKETQVAVRIRLKRGGRTNRPHYRVVAVDSRTKRDGKTLEVLGHYDPLKKQDNSEIDQERVKHWLSVGALPSETVSNILRKHGIEVTAK